MMFAQNCNIVCELTIQPVSDNWEFALICSFQMVTVSSSSQRKECHFCYPPFLHNRDDNSHSQWLHYTVGKEVDHLSISGTFLGLQFLFFCHSFPLQNNLQKCRNHISTLERENMMLLNQVKKTESQVHFLVVCSFLVAFLCFVCFI